MNLSPAILPALAALSVLSLLAGIALLIMADGGEPPQPPRHRQGDPDLGIVTVSGTIEAAPEPVAYDPLDPRTPLAEVERRLALNAAFLAVPDDAEISGLETWTAETREMAAA